MNPITAAVNKVLLETAKTLPPWQRYDNKNKPMTRRVSKLVKYEDLSPDQKAMIKGEHKTTGSYTIHVSEPIMANHYLNMVAIYKKEGQNGVNEYVQYLVDIDNDHKANIKKQQAELKIVK